MSATLEWIEGGDLLSVPGWRGAAVRCGLKPSGKADLALLRADEPNTASAVWTRNALPAAPVVLGRETLARSRELRSVVVNAGNANAMTGEQGLADARAMQARTSERCGGPALVLSTGVIGVPLPLERVERGIDDASEQLARECPEVADAILTTDTCRKTGALRVELPAHAGAPARVATVGGVAKGSGMIHPDMATMLALVACDQAVEPAALDGLLRRATDASFHEITVDGDTSTNDAVLLLSGPGGGPAIADGDPRLSALEAGITAVMRRLARAIVDDGEGRTRVMELDVVGAPDDEAARRVAVAVAGSSLVKTALAGGDPNWGRLLAAAANAGVPIDGERVSLTICGTPVFEAGGPTHYDRAALGEEFSRPEVRVRLDLGAGAGRAHRWTSDLSVDYVRINSEYTT